MNRRQFTFGALGAALAGLFVRKKAEPELPVETSGYLEVEPAVSWSDLDKSYDEYAVSADLALGDVIPFRPRYMYAPFHVDPHCPPGRIYAISSEFMFPTVHRRL